ncbi:MAG: SPOR domain-containing protein, partial [Muribaculaceae bacterium]|nr:SPOR domain-containing protein [Muribaculaceae bacterium]
MNQLINHITYLLDRHDCVTVPGFGTFLVHHAPARIDHFTHSILPPSRRVTFNSEADFADSLLVSSYARKNSLNYSDALEMMKGEINTFKDMFDAGG